MNDTTNLTYRNRATWDTPAPSMDDKHKPSPPLRTVEEYERDRALGFVVPQGRVYRPMIVNGKS